MKELEIREQCRDCGVHIGENHEPGCDVERCPFCGGQMISCQCQYEYFGIDTLNMEEDWKWIYENGLTDKLSELYEEYLQPYLIPWDGTWPGVKECREYGFWAKMTEQGWQSCDADDPEATEDLNTLHLRTVWDKEQKRYVLPQNKAVSAN